MWSELMKFETSPAVELLHSCYASYVDHHNSTSILHPFWIEINNIYTGYRGCYTKEPFTEQPMTEMEETKLRNKALAWYEGAKKPDQYNYPSCYKSEASGRINCLSNGQEVQGFTQADKFGSEVWCDADTWWNGNVSKYGKESWLLFLRKCAFINAHLNHESPFEHANLTWNVNCSRSCSHQLVRHRIASYSQASQRYIGENNSEIETILPTGIMVKPEVVEMVKDYLNQLPELITKLKELGVKNEDIRCIYPNAITTQLVITMNYRELRHFFKLRIDSHAQEEIRRVAYEVWRNLNRFMPFIWTDCWDRKVSHLI